MCLARQSSFSECFLAPTTSQEMVMHRERACVGPAQWGSVSQVPHTFLATSFGQVEWPSLPHLLHHSSSFCLLLLLALLFLTLITLLTLILISLDTHCAEKVPLFINIINQFCRCESQFPHPCWLLTHIPADCWSKILFQLKYVNRLSLPSISLQVNWFKEI